MVSICVERVAALEGLESDIRLAVMVVTVERWRIKVWCVHQACHLREGQGYDIPHTLQWEHPWTIHCHIGFAFRL